MRIFTDRKGKVFVHNWPHDYSFTARPCYGAVGTHPTGMLSCFFKFSRNFLSKPRLKQFPHSQPFQLFSK